MIAKKRLNINIKNSVLQGVLVKLVLMNNVTHCTFHKKFDALRLAGRTRFEYLYLAFSRKFSTKNHYLVTNNNIKIDNYVADKVVNVL